MPSSQPEVQLPASLSFRNKTILITGASAGIGLAAAEQLLIRGAKEIIAGVRSVLKGETTKSIILSNPEVKKINSKGTITVLHVNLEEYASVLDFAGHIKQKYDGVLDMVLLNAGTASLNWEIVATSGHEKTIQVNLLSPAMLALELLPTLEKTAATTGVPSRLTWVGSFVQFDHSLSSRPIKTVQPVLEHFDDRGNWSALARYNDSKLLGTLFVEHLAACVDAKKVIINEVSPGMVKTNFGEFPAWLRLMLGVMFYLKGKTGRTPDQGAYTYLHALGIVGEESQGHYLSDNQIAERAPFVKTLEGREVSEKLWNEMWKEFSKLDGHLKRLD